jgi:hypothetical protein
MLHVQCQSFSGFETKNLVPIYHRYDRHTFYIAESIVCYFESWATYRPGNGQFNVENIDPNLCTHLIYAFVGINSSAQVYLLDPWNDIDLGEYLIITSFKFNAVSIFQVH